MGKKWQKYPMTEGEQLLLPLDLQAVLSCERFYLSPSNQDAFLWIQRGPNWPQRSLAVYGPSGCGKTHLGHVWQEHTKAAWLTAEDIKQSTPFELLEQNFFWVIDNAHLLGDDLFLLQFYNLVQEYQGGLLLLAPDPPSRWKIQLADLRSRLHIIPTVEILQPDDILLRQVLLKLFKDKQVRIPEDVIAFLLRHMERSFAVAQTLVEQINQEALRTHRPITLSLIREIWTNMPSYTCLSDFKN